MTQPSNPAFNLYPYPKRKQFAKTAEPLTRPEEQLRRDLEALEAVQSARPLKPPGVSK